MQAVVRNHAKTKLIFSAVAKDDRRKRSCRKLSGQHKATMPSTFDQVRFSGRRNVFLFSDCEVETSFGNRKEPIVSDLVKEKMAVRYSCLPTWPFVLFGIIEPVML